LISETAISPSVKEYFESKGWKVIENVKLRGRIPDIIAIRDKKITVVELKAEHGSLENAVSRILHFKRAVDFSYLALPKGRISKPLIDSLHNFGIGLISVDGKAIEIVKPVKGSPLPSVQRKLFGKSAKKAKVMSSRSSLEHLFKGRGLVLILKLLYLSPGDEFHVNEIARRTGLSAPHVATELKVLLQMGLVNRRDQGNLAIYASNKKNLIFEDLRRILLKYEMADEVISRELPQDKIKFALIYGSFAKGTETAASDIDLLVVGTISEDLLLKAVMRAQEKVGREINYILWSEADLARKSKEGIPLIRELAVTKLVMIAGGEAEFKRSIA
jgi:predicted nucleotidyltransferase